MTVRKFNPLDPGDEDIRNAWEEWRFWTGAGKNELKAREWREMYLALLARRDRKLREKS